MIKVDNGKSNMNGNDAIAKVLYWLELGEITPMYTGMGVYHTYVVQMDGKPVGVICLDVEYHFITLNTPDQFGIIDLVDESCEGIVSRLLWIKK